MKSKLIILISCCLGLGLLPAQDYMFSPITIENGLSQSTVSAIVQDQKGFLWIGTQDGLNRFDGHEFKVYKKDPFDTTSITDNFISALFVDEADNLWVGTMNGGLNLIDASREYILHFQHDRQDSSSLSDNRISFIYQDANKRIWIGTPKGFDEVVVGEDGKIAFQHHRFLNVRRGKSFGLRGAMEDQQGRWWVATLNELYCCRLNEEGEFCSRKRYASGMAKIRREEDGACFPLHPVKIALANFGLVLPKAWWPMTHIHKILRPIIWVVNNSRPEKKKL